MIVPTSAYILPQSGGLYERQRDATATGQDFLWTRLLWIRERGEIIDCCAFEPHRPGIWWMAQGIVTHTGQHELDAAWWEQRPARCVATPADFIRVHGAAFLILDLQADVSAIFGMATAFVCESAWHAQKLTRIMWEQARPKVLITVGGHHA